MTTARIPAPDLPERMTWEELEQLPEEIAEQIELWDGRVVWVRRGPAEHQAFSFNITAALKRCGRDAMASEPEQCWRTDLETNVFFGREGKSNFLTPDFLTYRCLPEPYHDIRAADVLLVGEVLSPSNSPKDMEAKKARYAKAGIPWYWEVKLHGEKSEIASVQAWALELHPGTLADGVSPLHRANYLLAKVWTPREQPDGIAIEFPFPITIPWTELEF